MRPLVTLSIVCVALASVGGLVLLYLDTLGAIPFDSATWRKADEPVVVAEKDSEEARRLFYANTRARMIDDLTHDQRLVGLTRAEVLDLLGPPTGALPKDFEDNEYTYALGPAGLDTTWLTLEFSAGGRVKSFRLWSD